MFTTTKFHFFMFVLFSSSLCFAAVPKSFKCPNAVHEETVRRLYWFGTNDLLSKKLHFGKTLIFLAIENGNLPSIKRLIKNCGVNIEDKDLLGFTPFLYAAQRNNLEALKMLYAAEANIKAINRNGENALQLAYLNDAPITVIKYLVDIGVPIPDCKKEEIDYFLKKDKRLEKNKKRWSWWPF